MVEYFISYLVMIWNSHFWLFLYAISRVFYVLLYSDVESLYLNAIEYFYLLSYSDVESLCFEYDRVLLSPIIF